MIWVVLEWRRVGGVFMSICYEDFFPIGDFVLAKGSFWVAVVRWSSSILCQVLLVLSHDVPFLCKL